MIMCCGNRKYKERSIAAATDPPALRTSIYLHLIQAQLMSRHVTGIGGLFFRANDHQALAKWYNQHFGINDAENGFIWQQDAGPTVFSPFKRDTDYFGNDKQQFMLNLRVQDLDGLLKKLEDADVRIDPKRQDEDYGRFAWVYDPEGNKVELWEPK